MSSPTAGRQIALLALCQALLYINNVTLIATAAVLYAWSARPTAASAAA